MSTLLIYSVPQVSLYDIHASPVQTLFFIHQTASSWPWLIRKTKPVLTPYKEGQSRYPNLRWNVPNYQVIHTDIQNLHWYSHFNFGLLLQGYSSPQILNKIRFRSRSWKDDLDPPLTLFERFSMKHKNPMPIAYQRVWFFSVWVKIFLKFNFHSITTYMSRGSSPKEDPKDQL